MSTSSYFRHSKAVRPRPALRSYGKISSTQDDLLLSFPLLASELPALFDAYHPFLHVLITESGREISASCLNASLNHHHYLSVSHSTNLPISVYYK